MKWEVINLDFAVVLSRTHTKNNSIWVVMDRLTESSHIIFVKCTNTAKDYATFYTNEIESLHGIPLSIIFD